MLVWLEFKRRSGGLAANGTDVGMFIDGRWNKASRYRAIEAKVAELRSGPFAERYAKLHLVGFTRSMDRSHKLVAVSDPNPPWWAQRYDAGAGRIWRWRVYDFTPPGVFAVAHDSRGEEWVDECWQLTDLSADELTVQQLANAAMSFEAAYGEAPQPA